MVGSGSATGAGSRPTASAAADGFTGTGATGTGPGILPGREGGSVPPGVCGIGGVPKGVSSAKAKGIVSDVLRTRVRRDRFMV